MMNDEVLQHRNIRRRWKWGRNPDGTGFPGELDVTLLTIVHDKPDPSYGRLDFAEFQRDNGFAFQVAVRRLESATDAITHRHQGADAKWGGLPPTLAPEDPPPPA
jgi:hypothetical protein